VLNESKLNHPYNPILAYLASGIEFKGHIIQFDSLYAY